MAEVAAISALFHIDPVSVADESDPMRRALRVACAYLAAPDVEDPE